MLVNLKFFIHKFQVLSFKLQDYMFKKDSKENKITDEVETIIGPSVKVEGNFFSQGNIIIGGIIKGKIFTAGNLRVNENAKIEADIEAANAVIAGEVIGNIKILKNLQIMSSAKIIGDIITDSLSIEEGAKLNGKCAMNNVKPSEQLEQKAKELNLADKKEKI